MLHVSLLWLSWIERHESDTICNYTKWVGACEDEITDLIYIYMTNLTLIIGIAVSSFGHCLLWQLIDTNITNAILILPLSKLSAILMEQLPIDLTSYTMISSLYCHCGLQTRTVFYFLFKTQFSLWTEGLSLSASYSQFICLWVLRLITWFPYCSLYGLSRDGVSFWLHKINLWRSHDDI